MVYLVCFFLVSIICEYFCVYWVDFNFYIENKFLFINNENWIYIIKIKLVVYWKFYENVV